MSAITAAAHDRLVLLRRDYDAKWDTPGVGWAGGRYRDAVTLLALQTGQTYDDIDAAIRTEARRWADDDREAIEGAATVTEVGS